jgi:hypothetical protein
MNANSRKPLPKQINLGYLTMAGQMPPLQSQCKHANLLFTGKKRDWERRLELALRLLSESEMRIEAAEKTGSLPRPEIVLKNLKDATEKVNFAKRRAVLPEDVETAKGAAELAISLARRLNELVP